MARMSGCEGMSAQEVKALGTDMPSPRGGARECLRTTGPSADDVGHVLGGRALFQAFSDRARPLAWPVGLAGRTAAR